MRKPIPQTLRLAVGLGVLVAAGAVTALAFGAWGRRRWTALMRKQLLEIESPRLHGQRGRLTSHVYPVHYDARELDGLPWPVQRYFRAVLVDGQPVVAAASIQMRGTINMSTTGEQWKSFTSHQQVSVRPPGFLWDAQISLFPGASVSVLDGYVAGEGRLVAKWLGLIPLAEANGTGELARGEFMRYFAEAAWYPTALLPSQGVRWEAVDADSATATMVDGAVQVTLLFHFNDTGLIAAVHASQRGAGIGKETLMLPWECSFSNHQRQDGMLVPMCGNAAYVRARGRAPYFAGRVECIRYEFMK